MSERLEQRFVERVQELLVALPYDLKVLFEVMSDGDLSGEARQTAAGAVIYCLSASEPVSDPAGVIAYVDDTVLIRLTFARLLELGGEAMGQYPERFGEQFGSLEGDLDLLRTYLGDSMRWLERRLVRLTHAKYKGKRVAEYVEDDEAGQRLYEEGLEFATNYDVDEDAAGRLTRGQPVLEVFRERTRVEEARSSHGS